MGSENNVEECSETTISYETQTISYKTDIIIEGARLRQAHGEPCNFELQKTQESEKRMIEAKMGVCAQAGRERVE